MSKIFNEQGTPVQEVKSKYTYVGICLDRSGSMEEVLQPTIQGFNEWVQTVQNNASKGGQTRVSLITFGGDITKDFENLSPDKIRPLTRSTYRPNGNTPMYDAIGQMLDTLEEYDTNRANDDKAFLIIVISDGKNNSRIKYSKNEIVKRIINLKNTERWTFAYVGANQDLFEAYEYFGITNTLPWTYTYAGTGQAFCVLNNSSGNYFKLRSVGQSSVDSFFSEPQQDTTEVK